MKEAGVILLVFVVAICMTANDAWAGTQVYITFSIASGLFIGVVGVCLQVVFQQQIAQKEKEQKRLAAAQSSAQNPDDPDSSPPQVARADWASAHLDPPQENRRAMHPDFELNLFTFRW